MPVSLLFSAAISVGRGGFQSAGSERSHIPENGLGSGPRGPFPPKSSIAIIPEIAQARWRTLPCRILAAIWETVALFGWLATLASTLFSFVHASLRPFYHLCSPPPPAIPAYLVSHSLVSRCEIAICSQNSLIGLRIIDGCGGGSGSLVALRMTPACTDFHTVRRHSSLRPYLPSVLLWTGPSSYGCP